MDTQDRDLLQLLGGPCVGRCLFKPRKLAKKDKVDAFGGAVTLLGNNDFRLGTIFRSLVRFEGIGAVDEKHYVSILLDGSRFAKISELRAPILALRGASELAQNQYRQLQLFS